MIVVDVVISLVMSRGSRRNKTLRKRKRRTRRGGEDKNTRRK